ncbi:MAG TPA: hypothetical protein VFQ92_06920, partial [Blastocatellia bacterium]|nr:hypothetical protein [Blastocatellia bacterium]
IVLFVAITAARGDIKVTTRTTVAGSSLEGTTYIKGARQRITQSVGGAVSFDTIYQCDLKRMVQINDRTKRYIITPLEEGSQSDAPDRPQTKETQPANTRKGGVVTYTTTVTDTGERKDFFGFKARHIKTSIVVDSSPDACNSSKMRMETDGWYIDLEYGLYCSSEKVHIPQTPSMSKPECRDEIRYKTTGSAKLGFPVLLTTTIFAQDGRTTTTTMEVIELSDATLEASMFDIPAGYSQAKDYQELMGVPSIGSVLDRATKPAEPGTEGAATVAQPKREGTIRVGVVAINNKTDRSVSTDTIRGALIGNIRSSNIDAVAIDSTSPTAIEEEAKQKGCDYILHTEIAQLKKSGSKVGGLLGRATGVGVANERYEAQLDFRLFATGSKSPQLTSSSKAREEGPESVSLSAAAEREAKAVLSELQKKR